MIGQKVFRETPPVVKNLIIINAIFFLATNILPEDISNLIVGKLGLFFWESPLFMPYQLVTHMFLHGSFSHFFFNMFALWMFGIVVERDLGSKRFLSYYMITGIGAALIHMLAIWYEISNLELSREAIESIVNTVTIGASGAGFGVLLAFGMLHPNSTIMLLIPPIPIKAKYFVIIYGLLELGLGLADYGGNIAHFAHLGGLLWGYVLLRWWKTRGKIYY